MSRAPAAKRAGAAPTLSLRQLNRATLARQMLLERRRTTPLAAVEQLVALQAQLTRPPFTALWSRVHDFEREQLLQLIQSRKVVRAPLFRGTLHLMSARDFLRFRTVLQPTLTAAMAVLGKRAERLDLERTIAAARRLFEERPRNFDEVRTLLEQQGLAPDVRAAGYAARLMLPLLQVPSGGMWGYDVGGEFAIAHSWLGTPVHDDPAPNELALHYLRAFGPATAADATTWTGLKAMRAAFDELRPQLLVFRDEAGRELVDVADAPRPSADVEAPVRFLPEFDNLVLGHDDRTRVVATAHRPRIVTRNLQVAATFLVDGFVAGMWRTERKRGAVTLVMRPFAKLTKTVQRELREEALALLSFIEPDAKGHEVTIAAPE